MEVLHFFENLRTPVMDEFFSLITRLGEETFLIVIGLILFWCINKEQGYYVLSVGFMGLLINQFLKITFKVPRPWVKDPSFTIVESAREAATGYSFPSGHTQISVGTFGSIAKISKNFFVKVLCIIICVLVPVSRMYLGVHTPKDVLTSVAVALLLIFTFERVMSIVDKKKSMRIFLGIMTGMSVLYLLYVSLFVTGDLNDNNYISAIENAYKVLGCIIGLWCGYEIDNRFIQFDTKAIWWAQILKVVTGLVPLLLIKSMLKKPLALLLGQNAGDMVRYLLIAVFISGIWPITFKYFSKMGKTPKN